jgi:hypothetical protein
MMKALTICNPYPEMILLGEKPMENRTWPTSYRGPLLIHAGLSRAWLDDYDERKYNLTFGALVGQCTLVDCVRLSNLPAHLVGHLHANGPYCWLLEDIERFSTPIPWKGAQGLWDCPYIKDGATAA